MSCTLCFFARLEPVVLRLALLSRHLNTVSQVAQAMMRNGGLLESALQWEASNPAG